MGRLLGASGKTRQLLCGVPPEIADINILQAGKVYVAACSLYFEKNNRIYDQLKEAPLEIYLSEDVNKIQSYLRSLNQRVYGIRTNQIEGNIIDSFGRKYSSCNLMHWYNSTLGITKFRLRQSLKDNHDT